MPIESARPRRVYHWLLALCTLAACSSPPDSPSESAAEASVYVTGPSRSPEGSGKWYLGREIAQLGDTPDVSEWLERPGREAEEFPSRLIQALELAPTDVVADIGAGTGYFTFRMARLVTEGKVFAVDIQPAMLEHIRNRMAGEGVANIETVPGSFTSPNLPSESVDLALVVVSYHEFSHPREMMLSVVDALKPGGRFVLVEYRGEDPTVPVSAVRRMTEAQAIQEMRAVGLRWRETKNILPQQHFMVFEKPD